MDREGRSEDKMRKCRKAISLHFLIFSLHFLLIFSFSLHFLAARMPQLVQLWSVHVSPMPTAHHAYDGCDHDDDADIDNDNDDDNDEKLG